MDQQEVKKTILTQIRTGKPQDRPLPDVPVFAYYGDPVEDFIKHLLAFDGRVVECGTRDAAIEWLKSQPEMDASKNRMYSSATGVTGNVTENDLSDIRNAGKINICVTEGLLGVGEMGAIWVTDKSLKHPPCALLAPRLFIFMDSGLVVGGLHEAYARLKLNDQHYGSFYTGPSATADIEAVHITGAQGPLVFTVLLYNRKDATDPPSMAVNPNADTSIWMEAMEKI